MLYTLLLLLFIGVNLYHLCIKYFEDFLSYFSLMALNFMNFKVNIDSLKNVPHKSIIVMSHTSIYDFVICSMIYHAFFKKKLNIYFMMKEEFGIHANDICIKFFPYTRVISVGGEAVHSQNVVNKVINELKDCDNYALCIAPEGTRRCVEHIRSGFYYIARGLEVPVVYCGINFSTKEIFFEKGRKMGHDLDNEKKWFIEMCRKYTPLYPENCYYTADYYANLRTNSENASSYFEGVNMMNELNQQVRQNYRVQDDSSISTNESSDSYDSYISNIDSYKS